jgi:hypothetical protein
VETKKRRTAKDTEGTTEARKVGRPFPLGKRPFFRGTHASWSKAPGDKLEAGRVPKEGQDENHTEGPEKGGGDDGGGMVGRRLGAP